MAYQFLVDIPSDRDLQHLHDRLSAVKLIEYFPIDVGPECTSLGISIPFKSMDQASFEHELSDLMNLLVNEMDSLVFDLYTGDRIKPGDISELAKRISA